MILTEMIHDARIIPLDGRRRFQFEDAPVDRRSRGRWEGDTLVVETTNFNGKNPFQGSSENLRVIERFTRVADDAIQYRFTVEDPSTWPRPWTGELPMKATVGPIFEHACHEGNYGLYNTLSRHQAARAEGCRGHRSKPRRTEEEGHAHSARHRRGRLRARCAVGHRHTTRFPPSSTSTSPSSSKARSRNGK